MRPTSISNRVRAGTAYAGKVTTKSTFCHTGEFNFAFNLQSVAQNGSKQPEMPDRISANDLIINTFLG